VADSSVVRFTRVRSAWREEKRRGEKERGVEMKVGRRGKRTGAREKRKVEI
jgi:hypothetical protein